MLSNAHQRGYELQASRLFVTGSKSLHASGFVMGLLACANVLCVYQCLVIHMHPCGPNSMMISFSLISAPVGVLQLTRKGREAQERLRPRTGPPRWGRGAFKRACLAPTGRANAAHLPLQFYFHIISISKSCLAALAFASDKSRVREGWKKEEQ